MRCLARLLLLITPFLLLAAPAANAGALAAAEAYADGAQVAYEWCTKSKLTSARSCALNACENSGGDNCAIAEYCDPHKWAGILAMRRTDGTAMHTLVCERASRASIFVAVRKTCAAFRNKAPGAFKQCNVLTVIAPGGEATANTTRYRWRSGGLQAD
jgi:hypothetical protein